MAEETRAPDSWMALIAAALQKWRPLILVTSLGSWFGLMALQTGVGAFVAIWNAALFIGALVIITIPTRTITVIELLAPFSLGAALTGFAKLAGFAFDLVLGTKTTAMRALGVPLVEEVLKISPVLWILWRQRRGRALTLGATDILLLAALSGAGFYSVEEAFIIHNHHSWSFVGRFPTTAIASDGHGGHLIAGHAIWTAIAGLTIGIAVFLRGSRLRMLLIAASGLLWAILDHGANNYGSNFRDWLASVFRVVTANGHLSLYILLLGVCLALALDICFAYIAVPAPAGTKLPPFPSTWEDAKRAWSYLRLRRQFAYTVARYNRAAESVRSRLAVITASLEAALRKWRPRSAAATRAPV